MTQQIKQIPQKPTGTLQERLDRLNKEFTPSDTKVLIALNNADLNFDELLEEYVEWVERIQAFAKNGYSFEGLWFTGELIYES